MLTINKPFDNYEFVSLIPNTATPGRLYFPDLPNLRDVETVSIVHYPPNAIPSDSNGVVTTGTPSQLLFLTLVVGNEEVIRQLELTKLSPFVTNNRVNPFGYFGLDNLNIDFSKSYVELAFGTSFSLPTSVCFGVYYRKKNAGVFKPKKS